VKLVILKFVEEQKFACLKLYSSKVGLTAKESDNMEGTGNISDVTLTIHQNLKPST
jgi:hypothetical protein